MYFGVARARNSGIAPGGWSFLCALDECGHWPLLSAFVAPLTSLTDALQHHSPGELLALMRERRNDAQDTVRAFDHIIATLEGIVTSDELWGRVTVPGPRPAAARGAGGGGGRSPGGSAGGEAEHLASRAGQRLDSASPAAGQGRGHGRWGQVPRRVQILDLLAQDPSRWWPAQELSEAIGVSHHRQLRGVLSEMTRGGDLQRKKESAGLPASYRPAPAAPPASQEENVMSG